MFALFSFYFQSLIRTAEQLKIKGLCEINDHTNVVESDTEVIYPPHKKIRASRNYDANNLSAAAAVNSQSHNNNKGTTREETTSAKNSSSSSNATEKDAHQSITSQEDTNHSKNKSKLPSKESKSSSSNSNNLQQSSSSKNMASLDMGMVSKSSRLSFTSWGVGTTFFTSI